MNTDPIIETLGSSTARTWDDVVAVRAWGVERGVLSDETERHLTHGGYKLVRLLATYLPADVLREIADDRDAYARYS